MCGSMMMAMGKREFTAETHALEGIRLAVIWLLLRAGDSSGTLDVAPWSVDLTSATTIEVGIEADVLR